jgi:GNAT superfamily N-acetyltransferase
MTNAELRLRPLRAADIDALAAWLPDAAARLDCDRWASERALRAAIGNTDVLIDGDAHCLLEYQQGTPQRDAALVRFLAVDPAHRRLGLGGRAALALERRLRRAAPYVYVLVPGHAGLALYFWLRLGYQPLIEAEWPASTEGHALWLARRLAAPPRHIRTSADMG